MQAPGDLERHDVKGDALLGWDSDVEALGAEQPRCDSAAVGRARQVVVAVLLAAAVGLLVIAMAALHAPPPPPGRGFAIDLPAVQELVALDGFPAPNPNDLWGIHDLLLLGYKAPFMKPGSAGAAEIQSSALQLAEMLPQLHPHPPCRQQIKAALMSAGGALDKAALVAVAQSSWDCLPAKFTAASFDIAFTPDGLDTNPGLVSQALDPKVLTPGILGACLGTPWHRACSFWVSLHAMAYRADALGLSSKFMHAAMAVLAGGSTLCGGCTLHMRSLHSTVLSPAVISDLGELD